MDCKPKCCRWHAWINEQNLYESGTVVGQYQFREHWSAEGCIPCGGDFNSGSTTFWSSLRDVRLSTTFIKLQNIFKPQWWRHKIIIWQKKLSATFIQALKGDQILQPLIEMSKTHHYRFLHWIYNNYTWNKIVNLRNFPTQSSKTILAKQN